MSGTRPAIALLRPSREGQVIQMMDHEPGGTVLWTFVNGKHRLRSERSGEWIETDHVVDVEE